MAFTKCYFRFGDRLATSDSCHQIRYVSHERSREPRFLDERRRRLLIDLSFDGRANNCSPGHADLRPTSSVKHRNRSHIRFQLDHFPCSYIRFEPSVFPDCPSWLSRDEMGRQTGSNPAPQTRKSVGQLRKFGFCDSRDHRVARSDH
jgi:hypothetical protein